MSLPKLTEKLYYKDAYIKRFDATVLSVESLGEYYEVVLDRTAFFPEEGGQTSDTGVIGTARVIEVKERENIIVHTVDRELAVGETVDCALDFDERYEKMKCHTAEHLLCGIMHELYGAENIGFHLGEDYVTFDVSPVLTREELDKVEDIANRLVADNLPVVAWFPTKEELTTISYRSKSDITGEIRIVDIGEFDSCACCAPHVSNTGEIGLIKMLDFEKHRGGTRIYMLAGKRALMDYRARYTAAQKISALTSTPQADIVTAVEELIAERNALAAELKARRAKEAEKEAARIPKTEGNAVYLFTEFDIEELRIFINGAISSVGGILVALSGDEGDYKYVIGSRSKDLRAMSREINAALCGRGGGRSEMIQGSFFTTIEKIRDYFEK